MTRVDDKKIREGDAALSDDAEKGVALLDELVDSKAANLKEEILMRQAYFGETIEQLRLTIAIQDDALQVIAGLSLDDMTDAKAKSTLTQIAKKAGQILKRETKAFEGSKVTYKREFDMTYEENEFQTIIRAADTKSALYEYDQWLRLKVKYGVDAQQDWPNDFEQCEEPVVPFNSFVAQHFYQTCRDKLWEELRERNAADLD